MAPGGLRATVVERGYHGHLWRVVARVSEGLDLVAYSAQAVSVGQVISLQPSAGVVVETDA
jgi:hypothetical protein